MEIIMNNTTFNCEAFKNVTKEQFTDMYKDNDDFCTDSAWNRIQCELEKDCSIKKDNDDISEPRKKPKQVNA